MAEPRPSVVIAVGDELLDGHTQDTNSAWLAGRLAELGHPARRLEAVGDDEEAIVGALLRALGEPEVELILVCGGLGPTPDDRTIEAVAAALDLPLHDHPDALAHIRGVVARMHAAGWVDSPEPAPPNLRMARAPLGAEVLENRRGMAVGQLLRGDRRMVAVLPGVPRELRTIFDESLAPRLAPGALRVTVEVRYPGGIEAEFAPIMEAISAAHPGVRVGSYPQETRELLLRLSGPDATEVEAAEAMLRRQRPPA
jgi:nicotinamide-nucleotide amidase